MRFLTNLNLEKNELQNAVIQPLAIAPANPKAGQIYYNSTDGFLYRYHNNAWSPVGVVYNQSASSGAVVTGLSSNGTVTRHNVIDLTLTGYSPVDNPNVTAGMTMQQAIAALDEAINAKPDTSDIPNPSTTSPKMDGVATVGTETTFARGDHVHPTDTTRQAVISDLDDIRDGASKGATAYQKPSTGIPKTDLATGVQTSLGLADTALQSAPVTDVQINNASILDGTVAKIVYETGLGSDSSNAATVTAIRAFVNSSIENVAAYYITSNTTGAAFATKAALDVGPWYYAGETRTPTRNDYAIVTADENHDGQSARYTYVKADGQSTGQWAFQYTFNMSFTEAQINALNSGITTAKVVLYDAHLASTSNPHSVTKAQVGLSNVDNVKQWADSNHPTTIGGYGITDANIVGNKITLGANSVTPLTSVTLNGAASTSPAFYAPTTAGTSGQVLTSNGSGAPTWQPAPEAVHKYTATNSALTASGGAWTWTIAASAHGINNNAMFVTIYEVATGDQVIADVKVNATNYTITITIVDSASAGSLSAGTYRVVAIG